MRMQGCKQMHRNLRKWGCGDAGIEKSATNQTYKLVTCRLLQFTPHPSIYSIYLMVYN